MMMVWYCQEDSQTDQRKMELRIVKETLTFMVNRFSTVMPKPFNGERTVFQQGC